MLPELRAPYGIVVAARTAHSATEMPLETGDVIRSLNGEPMKTLYQLRDALAKLPPRSSVALQIQRDDRLMFITFTTELWRVSQEWPAVGAWWLVSSIPPFEAQGRLYGARNPFWIAVVTRLRHLGNCEEDRVESHTHKRCGRITVHEGKRFQ